MENWKDGKEGKCSKEEILPFLADEQQKGSNMFYSLIMLYALGIIPFLCVCAAIPLYKTNFPMMSYDGKIFPKIVFVIY